MRMIFVDTTKDFFSNANNKQAKQLKRIKGENPMKKTMILLLMLVSLTFFLFGCSDSGSGRRVCGHCGGAGYVRNGARNATEYAYMKSVCPYCHGSGYLN